MDRTAFYTLGTQGKRTAFHVEPCDPELDEHGIYSGEVRPTAPVEFRYQKGASGSTVCDLISTSAPPLVLVSDRLLSTLRGFTGWATFPATVLGKQGEVIPGYHGLVVTGRSGPIDDTRSRPQVCPPPVPGGRTTRQWFGLFFDEQTWDGSDLFVPEDTALTVAVERVKRAFEAARITNSEFTPLADVQNASLPSEFM